METTAFGKPQGQGSPQALKMALEHDGFIVQEPCEWRIPN